MHLSSNKALLLHFDLQMLIKNQSSTVIFKMVKRCLDYLQDFASKETIFQPREEVTWVLSGKCIHYLCPVFLTLTLREPLFSNVHFSQLIRFHGNNFTN